MAQTQWVDNFGSRCKNARLDADISSTEKARDRLLRIIPPRYVPTARTLSRIEAGEVSEEKVEGILVYGLAKIYGKRISELSEQVASEMEEVDTLLKSSSRWITQCAGQRSILDELLLEAGLVEPAYAEAS